MAKVYHSKMHIIPQDFLASSYDTCFLTREVGSWIYTQGAAERLVELDPVLLGGRVRGVASTLEAPVDRIDRGTEPIAIHHGVVTSRRGAGHPEPDGRLEGDSGIGRDNLGIVDSIKPDGFSGRLVVVVPRELDGAATVVLFPGGARDAK